MPSNVSIGGTDIYASHWLQNNEIREVFDRRAARFLSDLKETEPVLFIRDNRTAEIMVDDIEKFKGLIDSVNKDCNYCILLLTPPGVTKIRVPKVVHVETRQEDTIISEAIRLCKIQLTGM